MSGFMVRSPYFKPQRTEGSQRRKSQQRCTRFSCLRLLGALSFERGQQLVVHVPLLQNGKNRLRPEAGSHQLAENTRGLFLVLRLPQPLTLQISTRLFFLIDLVEGGGNRSLDDLSMDTSNLEVGDHPQAAKFLVVETK